MPGRFAGADPILFDLDGTLTESGPGIIRSVRYALAKMGAPALDDDAAAAVRRPTPARLVPGPLRLRPG